MTATATELTTSQEARVFFELRITGLPYVFVSGYNPYAGTGAWTTPTDCTVVGGMLIPGDSMTQEIKDLCGGIASAESMTVGLLDFTAYDSGGEYNVLGRVFASGRCTTATMGFLADDITCTATSGWTFPVNCNQNVTWNTAPSYLYVGAETIAYSGVSQIQKTATFTIGARNAFPCYSMGGLTFPPTPYHRIVRDSDGNATNATYVSAVPVSMVGRSVCLRIGHLDAAGVPCTEAEALPWFLGRLRSVEWNPERCSWDLDAESIVADLEGAAIAPGLGVCYPADDQFVLNGDACKFYFGKPDDASTSPHLAIPAGTYSRESLVNAINNVIKNTVAASYGNLVIRCSVDRFDGSPRFVFTEETGQKFWIGPAYSKGSPTANGGLLDAIGFDTSNGSIDSGPWEIPGSNPVSTLHRCVASREASCFINANCTFNVTGSTVGFQPFHDQDGTGRAYMRFATGQVFEINGVTATTLTTGNAAAISSSGNVAYSDGDGAVEAVVLLPSDNAAPTNMMRLFGQLLCSSPGAPADATWNVMMEGCGFGLQGWVDTSSFQASPVDLMPRLMLIDRQTKLGDLLNPVLQEIGLAIVWDHAQAKIACRRIGVPSAADASTFQFSESNRAQPQHMTNSRDDRGFVRSGWTLRWGYDWIAKDFKRADLSINMNWVLSQYGISDKIVKVEDRTLANKNWSGVTATQASRAMEAQLLGRAQATSFTYRKFTRSVNHLGVGLSPGTVHRIIDNTAHNPYTGKKGIVSADNVFGIVVRASTNLATMQIDVDLCVNTGIPQPRTWSPSALVDFDAASNGYNAGTKTVTFKRHYTGYGVGYYDGIDFVVGDKVRLIERDCRGIGSSYVKDATIASVAADGRTAVLNVDVGALSSTVETVMILQPYAAQTTTRKATVAFLADGDTYQIAAADTTLCRWG